MRDITLGITFYQDFTTRKFDTGVPTTLAGSPVLSVLEENNATPITSGVSVSVDRASVVGLNEATIVATGGNGFEAGKSYSIYISTGTVDSVSVVGEVVGEFTIGQSAAAVDLANSTDGLGALLADILDKLGAVDEAAAAGDPSSTESVMQYVKQTVNILAGAAGVVTYPSEAGPGNGVSLAEVLSAVHADVTAIAGSAMRGTDNAATEAKQDIIDTNIDQIEAAIIVASGAVETSGSNSSTQVQTDLAEATNDHYNQGTILFTSGAEAGQWRTILDYVGATGVISWNEALTGTPADDITFVLINVGTSSHEVWDKILTGSEHNIATSAGRRLRQLEQAFVLAEGVVDTVTDGHTLTLDASAVATAEFYEHARLQIEEGTGAGQSRIITDYTSGRVVMLDSDFITNPDTSSRYSIVAADVHVSVASTDLAVGFVATATSTTQITLDAGAEANADFYNEMLIVFTHGTGAGQATHITAYTAGRVATMSPALDTAVGTDTVYHIQAVVPISQAVKEIWDEAMVASTGAPAITGSMRLFMEWWATLSRNVVNQTATTTTVRNDADDGDIATSTVSDDGTTFVRGEFST